MADPTYIAPPIETDPDSLAQDSFTNLSDLVPGWEPAEGNLDTMVLEETSGMAAEVRDLASQVPTTIFRYAGATLFGIVPIDAAPAYASSTWIVQDNLGYTIPAGTQLTIASTGSDAYAFEVVSDVDIPPGSTSTKAGEVDLQALIPGADANGLEAEPQLVDYLPWVTSIQLYAAVPPALTSGGVDAELDSDYLDRLVQELQLLSPRPIVAKDFAIYYKSIAGVVRALALDGYNPAGGGTWNNERTVTLVAVDSSGNPVPQSVKDQGVALFAPGGPYEREANFLVYTTDPTYTFIDVAVQVTRFTDSTQAQVQADIYAALSDYLQPYNWGKTYTHEAAGVTELSQDWILQDHVYYLELTTLVNNVAGVDRVVSLSFKAEATPPIQLAPVRIVAAVNVALYGVPLFNAIGSDTVAAGDRVLLTAQNDPTQNGVWVIQQDAAWTRPTDSDTWPEIVGARVLVNEGAEAGKTWVSNAAAGGTMGSTAQNWSRAAAAGLGTADVQLPGAAPLTRPGIIAVTSN